jgi:hypothetical protein
VKGRCKASSRIKIATNVASKDRSALDTAIETNLRPVRPAPVDPHRPRVGPQRAQLQQQTVFVTRRRPVVAH